MRRDLSGGLYIILNVTPKDEIEAKIRGARGKSGRLYVKKDYYNLAAFEKWLPANYNLGELLKHIKRRPINRVRKIVNTPLAH